MLKKKISSIGLNPPCNVYEEQQVEVCLEPMLNFAQSLQSSKLWPIEGLKVFDELCEMYREFENCVEKLECKSNGAKAMQTSYGYMCGDGYQKFTQHVNCYVQVKNFQHSNQEFII